MNNNDKHTYGKIYINEDHKPALADLKALIKGKRLKKNSKKLIKTTETSFYYPPVLTHNI